MAKKTTIDAIIKLYSKLGGNLSDVLGTRSNVNFMGTGKTSEGFLDMDLNVEALGAISKSKALDELKSSVGFATADKLNDVQATKLLTNMMKMDEFYNPTPNITDLATRTRNLDAEGLASLRERTGDTPLTVPGLRDADGVRPAERSTMMNPDGTVIQDSNLMKRLDEIVKKKQAEANLPPPGSRGGPDDIAAPFQSAEETIKNIQKTPFDEAVEYNARPEDVVQNLVDQKFGIGYFDNVGSTPSQRGSAREFLVEALKKENPNQTNFADIVEAVDVKYITEGGGGLAGDPLTLVNKYFGPRIAEMVPSGASSEEIAIFTDRVLNNVVDANGLRPGDPRFDRLTARFVENFAEGGRVALRGGGMDASQDDFNTSTFTPSPGDTGGEGGNPSGNNNNNNNNGGGDGGNNEPPITLDTFVEKDKLIEKIPTAVGIEGLLTDKGKFRAILEAEEAIKNKDLGSGAIVSYDGLIGPVNVNAEANLGTGDKNLNLGYQTTGGTNIGFTSDLDDNYGFKISKTFAKGGLAKILEV